MEHINNYSFTTEAVDISVPPRQITPAKARDGRKFIPAHYSQMYTTKYWACQEKLDGERLVGHMEQFIRFTTRRQSKNTGLMNEKTNHVPHLRDAMRLVPEFVGSVIDGEVIHKAPVDTVEGGSLTSTTSIMNSSWERAIEIQQRCGWIDYYVFDCLFYKGEDMTNRPYKERYSLAKHIVDTINAAAGFELFHIVPLFVSTDPQEQLDLYNNIVENGGEGLVWKNMNSKYYETNAWVKQKKETTFDVVIDGWEYGKADGKYAKQVGALICTAMDEDGKFIEVCKVVPGDDRTRLDMTLHFEKYKGKVIEVAGQEATQKNNRIRHPRIVRFRPDKSPEMCPYSQFNVKED